MKRNEIFTAINIKMIENITFHQLHSSDVNKRINAARIDNIGYKQFNTTIK